MLKRMFLVISLSMMLLFVTWTCVGYQYYGAELVNHHLNLYGMFNRFKTTFNSLGTYNFLDDIRNLQVLTRLFDSFSWAHWVENSFASLLGFSMPSFQNNIFSFLVSAFNILISPITTILFSTVLFIYITASALGLGFTIIDVLVCCVEFAFMPMFI